MCETIQTLFPAKSNDDAQLSKIRRGLYRHSSHKGFFYPNITDLLSSLYRFDKHMPYDNLTRGDEAWIRHMNWYPSSAVNEQRFIYDEIISLHGKPPIFMIEVGCFIGTSSVKTWGPFVRRVGGHVVCVDTWEGDAIMKMDYKLQKFVGSDKGFPTMSNLFQKRVVSYNLTTTILPLPMASLTAARFLQLFRWIIDLVYVDSAHEQGETLIELQMYYDLLRPGGILMGDDFAMFPAVRHDVHLFSRCYNVSVKRFRNVWLIVKPNKDGRKAS